MSKKIKLREFTEPTNIVLYGTSDIWRLDFTGDIEPLTEEQRILLKKLKERDCVLYITDDEVSIYVDKYFMTTTGYLSVLTREEFDILKNLEESDMMDVIFLDNFVGTLYGGVCMEVCEDESPDKCKFVLVELDDKEDEYILYRRLVNDGEDDEDIDYDGIILIEGTYSEASISTLEEIREEDE